MTNHPNRGWRARWRVNLDTCTAAHKDGWVFRFARAADDPDALNGELVSRPPFKPEHLKMAARLAQEAGVIYGEVLDERH